MFFSRMRLGRASRTVALLAATVAFACFAQRADADPIQFEVTNLTFSGGDPTYSVATDVTFQNLTLKLNYSGGQNILALPSSLLDTTTIFEDSPVRDE